MERLYSQYKDRVEFFVVYVQEAHPTDGWQTDSNIEENILLRQHQSYDEREEAAQSCTIGLHISIPTLVEEMDNAIDEAYGAAPERLYLIGKDGKVVYHGGAGPHLFDLEELDEAIQRMEAAAKVG
ncbi:MAG: hypothetical protein FI731_00535 [SAR202 cluster bacterium]|mgnify:FL=1|nr:hypothetical protein [SAR202 cluster bacterium]|tara:strand:- start:232 stop:609 length:378 start_codon:yes stop_codon:yes gene_type:complete